MALTDPAGHTTGTTAPPTIGRVHRSDSHTARVSIDLHDAPEHRTPRGRAPMTPEHLHIEYSLPTADGGGGRGVHVELVGPPVRALRFGERYVSNMVRRLTGSDLPHQPGWLLDIIEAQRPDTWRGVVPLAGR